MRVATTCLRHYSRAPQLTAVLNNWYLHAVAEKMRHTCSALARFDGARRVGRVAAARFCVCAPLQMRIKRCPGAEGRAAIAAAAEASPA